MASALAYITSSLDALRESTVTEETASAKSLTKKGHPVPTPLTSETLEKLRSLHMSVSHQDDKDGSSEASSEASSPSDMISPTSTAPTSVAGSIPNTPAFADPAKRDLISKELPKENLTLAQRRRIPASAQKFKLYAKLVGKFKEDNEVPILLKRLEEENARLPPQDSTSFLLARLERQNALLDEDPKSVCIESNQLKANFSIIQKLVTDSTSPHETVDEAEVHRALPTSPLESAFSFDIENPDEAPIDWDFWGALIDDFPTTAAKLPHLLSAKVVAGLPPKLRGLIWQAMSQSASTNLEAMYSELVKDKSQYDRIIQRDLARTFPSVEMFKKEGGDGQMAMERVLKAYSLYDSHVGYCQGLAFLVGPLLMTMPERQAFCVFVRLMETYDMRTMFTLNMEGLNLRLYQFSTLLSQILPGLSAHLNKGSVHAAMYASQWFLTLFAYTYPISLVMRIYDVVFAEGAPETIMRVAIALMKNSEERLLQMTEFEEMLDFLTSKLYDPYENNPGRVIDDAMSLSSVITKDKMDKLAEKYVAEVEQEKHTAEEVLAVRFGFWGKTEKAEKAEKTDKDKKKKNRESKQWLWETDDKKSSKRDSAASFASISSSVPPTPSSENFSALTSKDRSTAVLHEQIEDLVMALSQLQKDHIQTTQELMTVKMEKMDVESEGNSLKKRLAALEKKVSKYQGKRQSKKDDQRKSLDSLAKSDDRSSMISIPSSIKSPKENDKQFIHFVENLRLSGDFGALVAGALASIPTSGEEDLEADRSTMSVVSEEEPDPEFESEPEPIPQSVSEPEPESVPESESAPEPKPAPVPEISAEMYSQLNSAHEEIANELVSVKLSNFELSQQLDKICKDYADSKTELAMAKDAQESLLEKILKMRHQIEKLETEKTQAEDERMEMMRDYKPLRQRVIESKKLAMELQLEKLSLMRDMEKLGRRVRELEEEKKILVSAASIAGARMRTEEALEGKSQSANVSAAGAKAAGLPHKDVNRRHTVQFLKTTASPAAANTEIAAQYQQKYIETDNRCRELEQMLAEAKLKIAEMQSNDEFVSSPMSLTARSNSSSSLTALALNGKSGLTANKELAGRSSVSLGERDFVVKRRPSVNSDSRVAIENASANEKPNKRASMYARVWGAISDYNTTSKTSIDTAQDNDNSAPSSPTFSNRSWDEPANEVEIPPPVPPKDYPSMPSTPTSASFSEPFTPVTSTPITEVAPVVEQPEKPKHQRSMSSMSGMKRFSFYGTQE